MINRIITVIFALTTVSASAGEYTSHCYDKGLHKIEVYECLDQLEQSAKKELHNKLSLIQNKAQSYGSSIIEVSNEDLSKMAYSFDNYVGEQCNLIGGYLLGSGAGQESQDCRIRLLHSRIQDMDYILKSYYQ